MKYELTKDLETGNAVIDSEHRQLFKAVNDMMDACAAGQGRSVVEGTVKFLLSYVDQHFAHEEQLQVQSNYPNYAAHKQFHENYKATLKKLAAELPRDNIGIGDLVKINNHVGVLVSHIRTEDKKVRLAHL